MFSDDRLVHLLIVALFMYSSIRCPPMAVSASPIGTSTPNSDSRCPKYQHDAPIWKSGYDPPLAADEPVAIACTHGVSGGGREGKRKGGEEEGRGRGREGKRKELAIQSDTQ